MELTENTIKFFSVIIKLLTNKYTWFTIGILLLLCFIMMWIVSIYNTIKKCKNENNECNIAMNWIITIITTLIYGFLGTGIGFIIYSINDATGSLIDGLSADTE